MIRILILEDNLERRKQFRKNFTNAVIVFKKTVPETIERLQNRKWDYLFLDHDLGDKIYVESNGSELTGYHVAKFLYNNPQFKPEHIYTHSFNENGRKNIVTALPECEECPGVWTQKNRLQ